MRRLWYGARNAVAVGDTIDMRVLVTGSRDYARYLATGSGIGGPGWLVRVDVPDDDLEPLPSAPLETYTTDAAVVVAVVEYVPHFTLKDLRRLDRQVKDALKVTR